ncbi:BamA/TamA family outer membrane protein [Fulvivirgaceae bacterium PWU4]|uniref:BamA/TamA family outer membrane protein n=1 Tax=Chryseosolibacter histidini TaxID=2782349 RepID=A0AAP2DNT8_9BACT|nr:BamA/TamA family outer membrane protein [Chryseosolibacter histidini]MBT1698277.1 BamA/TamA family outer membrane protein [Chryseosolibacter histidini]
MITTKSKYFILILVPVLLTGCLGTQHLKEGQKRLIQQSVKAPEGIDHEALRNLYAQRPNRRLLGLPIYHLVGIYYWGEKTYDREKYVRKKEKVEQKFNAKIAGTSSQRKINNYQFRKQKKMDRLNSFIENGNHFMQWGEQVAVFDSGLVETTINRFRNYLFSEGYFHNHVTTKTTSLGKFVSVSYRVEASAPYMIDTIFYRISDSSVYRLIKNSGTQSYIRKNHRYRQEDFEKERERLDLLLKDNGYFDFSRQYVDFSIDTAMRGNRKVAVMIEVLDPAKRGYHKQFRIDSVRFTADAGVTNPGFERTTRTYRDVQYSSYHDYYSLKILSQRLFLSPENLYSLTKTYESQRQLANLDAFKFVNINYDTSGGKFIANIFASPLKRYEWTNELGVNVTQGYPGPFYSVSLKKRNIFRGLENLELSGRFGVEGVASATEELNVYKSIEASANAALIFPQFIWPFREATQIRLGKYNPKTRLSLGYTYTDRPEYRRTSTTFSNTYTWQNQRTTQYSLALTNISLIDSKNISAGFKQRLHELDSLGNYNLARSFDPSFVSSMIFSITWNRDYGSLDKHSIFIRSQFETGGTTLNLIDTDIITDQGLKYFKYLRFSFDVRRVRILNKWAQLAYRFNTGIAYSYGSNNSLPYEKYYFAGGSRSVRAWRPRRLGLGSLPPPLAANPVVDGTFSYQFERPGEILMEGSLELRTKLVGFIDGAVFVDAGNVWTFKQQKEATGTGNSQFKGGSFYKELGIGTGFGLRFDFTFLILCFDVGIKAYDPARDPGDRFVLDKVRFFKPYARKVGEGENTRYLNIKEPVIYNIGIGYPF